MAAKANARRFRIGVEGATTDGRTIDRAWLEQMAANYDPAVYTALINMEHIKGYTPDSPFRRYGKIEALETEEIQDGLLSGKLALYAYLAPTDDLIALTQKWQKTFTSMEVNPDFADTGAAYLVGLAVTDDPASLGTEMLTFSAGAKHNPLAARKQAPGNLFTAAEETQLVFEPDDNKPSLFGRISALFAKKQTSDDARFGDVHQAVELVAQEQQQLAAQVQQHGAQLARLTALEIALQAHKTELASLKETLGQQDRNPAFRPLSTGGADTATVLTDC
ncbi:hypothetical protein EFS38_03070 [Dickeya undicola]|uniref:GPO family capsid scaffolding protein n=1 Tax=Dickeya undicola TaxID=1577887 RepID=A0ABX9WXE8_9GAMM|nr:GPO family capsid scaffolding protein [Dickeya undicola]RNM26746.1 hypothetical protein EFS38_03070 [Dickeya undicola]